MTHPVTCAADCFRVQATQILERVFLHVLDGVSVGVFGSFESVAHASVCRAVGEFLPPMKPSHQPLKHGTVMLVILLRRQQMPRRSTILSRINTILLPPTLIPQSIIQRHLLPPPLHLIRLPTLLHQIANLAIDQRAHIQPISGRAHLRQETSFATLVIEPTHLVIQSAHDHGVIARAEVGGIPQHGDDAQAFLGGQVFQQELAGHGSLRSVDRSKAGVRVGRLVRQVLPSRSRGHSSADVGQRLVVIEITAFVRSGEYSLVALPSSFSWWGLGQPHRLVHEVGNRRPSRFVKVVKVEEIIVGIVIVDFCELLFEEEDGVECC
mmetsp:Transcript_40429/g.87302  ORF Transcript_40429/g.87302 Transcript_40429/m.87302 type:complete len:323 (+) Transcript_40429:533-1501(+)